MDGMGKKFDCFCVIVLLNSDPVKLIYYMSLPLLTLKVGHTPLIL